MSGVRYGALALALVLSGCAGVTAADRAPRSDTAARLAPAGPSPWTLDLDDPVLADLLRRADGRALDVKTALARLAHARADAEAASAAWRLHLDIGTAGALGGRTFRDLKSAATPTAEANYDVDLWGRGAAVREAALADQAAAADDLTGARLLVAAETVRAYVALRTAQAGLVAARRESGDADDLLALVVRRADEGAATAEALMAARQGAVVAKARILEAQEDLDLQAGRLRDLLDDPALAVAAGDLPASIRAVAAVSSDLVDGRPDVQAAMARLRAADARRAAAIAASRPQFQISALLGAPDASVATLLDARTLAWAAAGAVTQQVLDGGANRARIHAATADADEADIAYRRTVLTAWSEVRAALVAQARAGREAAIADDGLASAALALERGRARHDAGLVDGVALAELRSQRSQADGRRVAARGRMVEARVRLALATGGH